MPHAPLLIPHVAPGRQDHRVERVRAAVRRVARDFDRLVAVVSPHGAETGVYLHPRGDLAAFGLPRTSARATVPAAAVAAVAEAWGRPVLEEPLDHGIVVPMLLGALEVPLLGVGLAEDADPTEDAAALAEALAGSRCDVIASVNTGAGITSTAPATALDGAIDLEADLRNALATDLSAVGPVAGRLAANGASCSLGPLLVLARLFRGGGAQVLAHEWPFGVGYLVARVEVTG